MFFWPRRKRWREGYHVESYSTRELAEFLEAERVLINRRAPQLWEHIKFESLLTDEIQRRQNAWIE